MRTGTDFSGVGAFDQALDRLGITQDKVFACEMDRYARQTYELNFGAPSYYPTDVYQREIPTEPLDLYMTTPPCQGFSVAGMREGSILFMNSHEFIKKNNPRYFIFENVKGLLSHNRTNKNSQHGNTFQQWLNFLGGKSVNGIPTLFAEEDSVPYHIYYRVLNATNFDVPQNRERVFIVGIRDDADNHFQWAKDIPLTRRLVDVLEDVIPDKYYLSRRFVDGMIRHVEEHKEKGNGFKLNIVRPSGIAGSLTAKYGARQGDTFIAAHRGRGENNVKQVEIGSNLYSNALCTAPHSNWVFNYDEQTLRKLTPLECVRLMDFNDSFQWNVSDTQLYKQTGNSVVVSCIASIVNNLNLN